MEPAEQKAKLEEGQPNHPSTEVAARVLVRIHYNPSRVAAIRERQLTLLPAARYYHSEFLRKLREKERDEGVLSRSGDVQLFEQGVGWPLGIWPGPGTAVTGKFITADVETDQFEQPLKGRGVFHVFETEKWGRVDHLTLPQLLVLGGPVSLGSTHLDS